MLIDLHDYENKRAEIEAQSESMVPARTEMAMLAYNSIVKASTMASGNESESTASILADVAGVSTESDDFAHKFSESFGLDTGDLDQEVEDFIKTVSSDTADQSDFVANGFNSESISGGEIEPGIRSELERVFENTATAVLANNGASGSSWKSLVVPGEKLDSNAGEEILPEQYIEQLREGETFQNTGSSFEGNPIEQQKFVSISSPGPKPNEEDARHGNVDGFDTMPEETFAPVSTVPQTTSVSEHLGESESAKSLNPGSKVTEPDITTTEAEKPHPEFIGPPSNLAGNASELSQSENSGSDSDVPNLAGNGSEKRAAVKGSIAKASEKPKPRSPSSSSQPEGRRTNSELNEQSQRTLEFLKGNSGSIPGVDTSDGWSPEEVETYIRNLNESDSTLAAIVGVGNVNNYHNEVRADGKYSESSDYFKIADQLNRLSAKDEEEARNLESLVAHNYDINKSESDSDLPEIFQQGTVKMLCQNILKNINLPNLQIFPWYFHLLGIGDSSELKGQCELSKRTEQEAVGGNGNLMMGANYCHQLDLSFANSIRNFVQQHNSADPNSPINLTESFVENVAEVCLGSLISSRMSLYPESIIRKLTTHSIAGSGCKSVVDRVKGERLFVRLELGELTKNFVAHKSNLSDSRSSAICESLDFSPVSDPTVFPESGIDVNHRN